MKEFWNVIQLIFTAIGGWLGYFLGGCDGLLFALLAFVVIDYITGVMCAIVDKNLSSAVGFKGICRKALIFCTGRYRAYPGHPCHWRWQRTPHGCDFLLHLQ